MHIRTITFTGEATSAEDATAIAAERCNEWLDEHGHGGIDDAKPIHMDTAMTICFVDIPEGMSTTYTHTITVLYFTRRT